MRCDTVELVTRGDFGFTRNAFAQHKPSAGIWVKRRTAQMVNGRQRKLPRSSLGCLHTDSGTAAGTSKGDWRVEGVKLHGDEVVDRRSNRRANAEWRSVKGIGTAAEHRGCPSQRLRERNARAHTELKHEWRLR